MKKLSLFLVGAILLSMRIATAATVPSDNLVKFYGKIKTVDVGQKNLTLHNNKKNADMSFNWDDQTQMLYRKNPIKPSDFKVGQFIVISYLPNGSTNQAKTIVLRD